MVLFPVCKASKKIRKSKPHTETQLSLIHSVANTMLTYADSC